MKKVKNFNINFTTANSLSKLLDIVTAAKKEDIKTVCVAVSVGTVEDLECYRGRAKVLQDRFGVTIIIGIQYHVSSAHFAVYGEEAVTHLATRTHSESSLMEAKALYNCAIILSSVRSVDMDMLRCSFNVSLIDAYMKYRNGIDELSDTTTYVLKQNVLWDASPLAGSTNCEESYTIIKKDITKSKYLVAYLLEKRPISLFSKLMLS